MKTLFHADPDSVLADDLDGEIVLLHLATGNYYSLAGSGAEIWRELATGKSLEILIEDLGKLYPASTDAIGASVAKFVEELVAEELLSTGAAASEAQAPEPTAPTAARAATFEPPALAKYTDMQDLLLLDPIHEVDEAGWPARPESENS